jgi:arsenate reductase-like glutaredoxin family protein
MSTRTLITGIAVLLLSTGTAHAGWQGNLPPPKQSLPSYPPAICVTPDWTRESCKDRQVPVKAESKWTYVPPPEYDKPYPGVLMIQRLPQDELRKVCATSGIACSLVVSTSGKSWALSPNGNRVACVIIMPSDEVLKAEGSILKTHIATKSGTATVGRPITTGRNTDLDRLRRQRPLNRYQHNTTATGAQSNPFKSSGRYTSAP